MASPSKLRARAAASTTATASLPAACLSLASRASACGSALGSRGNSATEPYGDHRDEAGAETLDAGIILVARGLIDRALAAELGLARDDRQAVRLHAAIAATLADAGVDEQAARRVGIGGALAPAALFG